MAHILAGDIPFIMTYIAVMICFIIWGMDKGGPFRIEGVDISLRAWGLLLLSISGVFLTLYLPFIWRSLLSRKLYIALARSLAPLFVVSGPLAMAAYGINTATIIYLIISISAGGSVLFLIRDNIKRIGRPDILFLIFSFALLFTGTLFPQRGMTEFLGIWFIPNSFMAFVGALLFPAAVFRMDIVSTMQTRSSLIFPSIFLTLVLTTISIVVHFNVGSRTVSGLFWFITLVFLMISLSHGMIKRKMDADLVYSFRTGNYNRNKAEEFRKKGDSSYLLHHLDMAINSNPLHGLGDIPQNGNLIFSIHGKEGWSSISRDPDEYVAAHCEKARLLSSRGRFVDAVKEYRSAITKGPDHFRTYYHLAMLQASIAGRSAESGKNLDMFLTSRKQYLARLMSDPPLEYYVFVLNRLFGDYCKTLEKKMEILSELGRSGDIWSYYTLMRES
jgi:tetratricopeptide (TPR) repeat protein